MNQAAKQYLKQIKRHLPYSASQKKRYIGDITDSIISYVQEHPDCDFEELSKAFGTPGEIVESYITDLSSGEYHKKLSTQKIVRIGIVLGLLLTIVIAVALISSAISDWKIANGYYYDTIYELPEDAPAMPTVYEVY